MTTIGHMLQAEIDPRFDGRRDTPPKLDLVVFAGEGANDERLRRIAYDAIRTYLPESAPKMVPDISEDPTFHTCWSMHRTRCHCTKIIQFSNHATGSTAIYPII